MAKRSINTWNGKKFSFRIVSMDLQCVIWYAFVFFINLQITSCECLGENITVSTYPKGDIRIPYPGTPLKIYCTADNNYTADDLEFRLGGNPLLSEKINNTTIVLYYSQPEIQYNTYYCTNKASRRHCVNKVLVDKPPTNVADFRCISKNLDSLKCSWTIPKTYTHIGYNLTFFFNHVPVKDCITERLNNNTVSCTWNTTTTPRYRQQLPEYIFNLVSTNVFGTREQNFTVDHFSIVKPDSPMDLKVIAYNTHSVFLQWMIPNNMGDLLTGGLDHKIEYQIAKIDKRTYFRQVNATVLLVKDKTYRFELSNLPYAHMQYEVRIYIKPKKAVNEEFWSDPSYVIFHTLSEIPSRPPDIAAGAFVRSKFTTYRGFNVYWKQLEEYEESGANFTYRVLVSQNNRVNTVFPEQNKSLSYVAINTSSPNPIHITIQSMNSNGTSLNSSHLYIPSEGAMLMEPKSFTKLAYENGTYELSWDNGNLNDFDNYTLFWCNHNYTHICVGRMDFITLQPNKSNHIIDMPNEKKYQFAIAVNKGLQTSGMVWAKCDISRDAVSMYAFSVHLKYGVPGKRQMPLSWSMDCTFRDGIITGYNITYCPVINDTNLCDNSVSNKSVYINNSKIMDHTVTGLLPFRTYRFDISLNTTYGLKITNATTYVTTVEDAPSEPVNVSISDIKSDSLVISWDPPIRRNGNIVKYVIYNYDKEMYKDAVLNFKDISRRNVTLNGLHGFNNYSLSVVACTSDRDIDLCSRRKQFDGILVRTRIGSPSVLDQPYMSDNMDQLEWNRPEYPSGPVDFYQLKRDRDNMFVDIYNTTELKMQFKYCDGVKEFETYQVRGVNINKDDNHGAWALTSNVQLPIRLKNDNETFLAGEWSPRTQIGCRSSSALTLTVLSIVLLAVAIGMVYGMMKLYRKYRKMEDIKPVMPNGLGVSEKDLQIPKFVYGGWKGTADAEKMSSSDEVLLLPNKTGTQTSTIKHDKTGSHDHTDITTLSHSSLERPEQGATSSDEGSTSSLHLEGESTKTVDDKNDVENEDMCVTDIESSKNNSPYIAESAFMKNPGNGYVQAVPITSTGDFGDPRPMPVSGDKYNPTEVANEPTTSSYVMAGLSSTPIFTTGGTLPKTGPSLSGYVRPEDVQPRHKPMKFPTLGTSPTKGVSPESLPTMPTLPSMKCDPNSSYIQLHSLDPLPTSLKPVTRNSVPLKPVASTGYVSPANEVMNKQLNILAGGHLGEDSAILDPTMSPDAYCRFSWSSDPTNDNLRAILAESTARDSSRD